MSSSRRKFTAEEKYEMVKEVLSKAKSVSEICREHNIHPNQYYRWQRNFLEGALEGFRGRTESKKLKRLEAEKASKEAELNRLNGVVAEVVKENIVLKKKYSD